MFANDRDLLRTELQFLKNCQVQYFILSVAATGAIAGFGDKMGEGVATASSIYLAPLLVILPCWWIFFDKATTISRIVAFVRLIETGVGSSESAQKKIPGWESALSEYRRRPRHDDDYGRLTHLGTGIWKALRPLVLDTPHKYWSINWWTFAVLSGSCLWLSYLDSYRQHPWPWRVAFLGVVASAAYNLSVVGHLSRGSYSYAGCYQRWLEALKLTESNGELF